MNAPAIVAGLSRLKALVIGDICTAGNSFAVPPATLLWPSPATRS